MAMNDKIEVGYVNGAPANGTVLCDSGQIPAGVWDAYLVLSTNTVVVLSYEHLLPSVGTPLLQQYCYMAANSTVILPLQFVFGANDKLTVTMRTASFGGLLTATLLLIRKG